jgi:exonuclease VII large subunit
VSQTNRTPTPLLAAALRVLVDVTETAEAIDLEGCRARLDAESRALVAEAAERLVELEEKLEEAVTECQLRGEQLDGLG